MKLTIRFLDDTVEEYDIDSFHFSYMYPDKLRYVVNGFSYDIYFIDIFSFEIS